MNRSTENQTVMNTGQLDDILKAAGAYGYSDAEVYAVHVRALEVRVFDGVLNHYENSEQYGLGFRGLWHGRMGYAFSETIEPEAWPFLLAQAAANAEIMDTREPETLFAGETCETPDLCNPAVDNLLPAYLVERALEMEAAAKETDSRITRTEYSLAERVRSERLIINTCGLSVGTAANQLSAFVLARAEAQSSSKQGGVLCQTRTPQDLDAQGAGRRAAAKALALLHARPIRSGSYPVVLDAEAATDLLRTFMPVFFADKVQQGFSLLGDRLGRIVGSSELSLVDRPTVDGSLYYPPFDGEGVGTRPTVLIEQGLLTGLLHSRQTAAKAGVTSTGNGFRSGYKANIQVAAANGFIVPGADDPGGLLRRMDQGLLITGLSGLHAGTHVVSGDFSLLAEGFWIEHGLVVHPVDQITLAGNFYQLLQRIMGIGNDLHFDSPAATGQIGSPSLLIGELAVAGL